MTYDDAVDMQIDDQQWERHYGSGAADRHSTEYLAEIQRRADALIDDGDLDAIRNALDAQEWTAWQINMRVICRGKVERSRERAANEVRELIRSGAFKAATEAYRVEMVEATKKAALARHYHMMERCAA